MVRQVAFGPFTIDFDTRELLREGHRVQLSPKAYELLSVLVEQRPTALAKAALHERLWPSTFVSDATLASLVKELRIALEETGREPRFIRTVHGFGYAFSGTACEVARRTYRPIANWLVCDGIETPLADGEHVIGRDSDATVMLNSPTVSRRHARVAVNGEHATLEDLASKNGTFLRGQSVKNPVRLVDGDRIRIGSFELVFRALSETASTETGLDGLTRSS